MAHAVDFTTTRYAGAAAKPGLRARIVEYVERRRRYDRIMRELMTYTDNELADLGLNRADFPAVASGTFSR